MMRSAVIVSFMVVISLLFASSSFRAGAEQPSGKDLFDKFCAVCHPGGGNKYFPEYTLRKKDLEAYGFATPEAIVNKMRNPGEFSPHAKKISLMKKFDEQIVSDRDAYKIAEYILNTFR